MFGIGDPYQELHLPLFLGEKPHPRDAASDHFLVDGQNPDVPEVIPKNRRMVKRTTGYLSIMNSCIIFKYQVFSMKSAFL